jgi:hypothetical protein
MYWPQRKVDLRAPNSFLPEPVDFVGQQSGPAEDELQAAFCEVLASTPTVQSAYLARIYRGRAPQASVAVCIRSSIGVDDKLEERLSAVFRSRFRPDQSLDFLFLLPEEELRVRDVCPPFYEQHR